MVSEQILNFIFLNKNKNLVCERISAFCYSKIFQPRVSLCKLCPCVGHFFFCLFKVSKLFVELFMLQNPSSLMSVFLQTLIIFPQKTTAVFTSYGRFLLIWRRPGFLKPTKLDSRSEFAIFFCKSDIILKLFSVQAVFSGCLNF